MESAVGPHHHAGADLAGSGAFHVMHGDESGVAVPRHEIGKLAPDSHPMGLPRNASQARRIASGVAGALSGTGFSGSSAWMASASAQKTLFASMTGGSPTALER